MAPTRRSTLATQYRNVAKETGTQLYLRLAEIIENTPTVNSRDISSVECFLIAMNQFSIDVSVHGRSYRTNIEKLLRTMEDNQPLQRTLAPELNILKTLDERLKGVIRELVSHYNTLESFAAATEGMAHKMRLAKEYWWYHPFCSHTITNDDLAAAFGASHIQVQNTIQPYLNQRVRT